MSTNIYGPYAGRFTNLESYPLWDKSTDEDAPEPTPNYYGQTRELARRAGTLLDLAGGCVGIVFHTAWDGAVACAALDETCETLGVWFENADGEQVGDTITLPFTPFTEGI